MADQPERQLYHARNKSTSVHVPHDDAYWARLRKEFQEGSYPHSGAYSPHAYPPQVKRDK